jgi:hypothetical protein
MMLMWLMLLIIIESISILIMMVFIRRLSGRFPLKGVIMAIRPRTKYEPIVGNKIFLEVFEANIETGVAERKLVDQCAELPDPKTLDLELMLKAGVPLDQVNCKLLDPVGTVGLADNKSSEKAEVESKSEEE